MLEISYNDKGMKWGRGDKKLKAYISFKTLNKLEASGASDIQLTVNKEINAVASGSSDIIYKGSATVSNVKGSGTSSVKKSGR